MKKRMTIKELFINICLGACIGALIGALCAGVKYLNKDEILTPTATQEVLTTTTQGNLFPGVVKLAINGKGFCSGLVISDTEVLTAAHCVVAFNMYGELLTAKDVVVQSIPVNDELLIAPSEVVAFQGRQDVAILIGDYKGFSKIKIETNPNKDILVSNYNIASCGFPYGGELVCYRLKNPGKMGDMIFFSGQMYAGMSGGPVIDLNTGTVYAVNHAVMPNYVVVAPIVNLFESVVEVR